MAQYGAINIGALLTASGVSVAGVADIEVRRESDGALAAIYSDESGTTPIAQPGFQTDASGRAKFYSPGTNHGLKITITKGAETYIWRNVPIGTAGQRDCSDFGAQRMAVADAAAARALDGTYSTTQVDSAITTTVQAKQAVRQTALFGATDASGYANFLQAGAGLRLKVLATSVALALSFANGLTDTLETFAADDNDVTGANLPTSNTVYVYRTAASAWGTTLVPPDYGYAFDRTRGALLNFEAADASTTMLDDFGNTWTASGNAQIDTAQKKFGTASLLLDGTGDKIASSNITTLGDGSWEISFWFRINALPGSGARAQLVDCQNAGAFGARLSLVNNAGTTKLRIELSSNGTGSDIANADGTNAVWTLAQWNKVRFVFDALAGTYRVYLSLNGAAETQDYTTSSTARVCTFTSVNIGDTGGGGSGFNGWIDAFRLVRCATATSTQTPSAVAPAIGDFPYHFFSIPKMQMLEVTGASAAAGQDPAMTQRNRVFVGEADTGAAAVSAVRCYALRGEYDSGWINGWADGTIKTWNHNIGLPVDQLIPELTFKFKLTLAGSYLTGETLVGSHNLTVGALGRGRGMWANAIGWLNSISERANIREFTTSTGSGSVGNWIGRLRIRRAF